MIVRTLLVDDNQDFLNTAKRILSRVPQIALIGTATEGNTAVATAQELKPDLIFMDLVLPGINGLEATRQIKAVLSHVKVVVLTLYDLAEYRTEALAAGVDIFLHKSELSNEWLNALVEQIMTPHKKLSVLVADDSPTIRRMVMATLAPLKADFGEASTGLEVIEQLALNSYDILTLDLNMPDMHGMEVLSFIRNSERYRQLPIIVLTTRGDDTSRHDALAAGADLYLTKPFKPEELIQAVKGLVRR